MNDTTLKADPVLEAALAVFAQHGTRKTTMSLIAKAAQVSRQTLYGRYENKDGILYAAMLYHTGSVLSEIRADWSAQDTLADKLWTYFNRTILDIYRLIKAMPDAEEFLSGLSPLAQRAYAEAEAQKIALLSELFAPYEAELVTKGESAARLARFTAQAAAAQKHSAATEDELTASLTTLHHLLTSFLKHSTP